VKWLVPVVALAITACQRSSGDGATATPPKTEKNVTSQVDPAVAAARSYIQEMTDAKRIDKGQGAWRTRLPKQPDLSFEDGTTYYWALETNKGAMKLRLLPDVAPKHVANFIYLSELGFFDGLKFHRVIPGFMAQGGCPLGTGTGSPGYRFSGEFSPTVKHDKPGILSMANAGPGTDGSQFFITFVPTPHLNNRHTVFGELVAGEDTLRALEAKGSRSGRTAEELKIEKAYITVE
jgi:cyclophilin family peptidyl-prolyl cis-trans isomerase